MLRRQSCCSIVRGRRRSSNARFRRYTSDANLTFRQGVGMEYPFTNGGGVFRPRVWNGRIHYALASDDPTLSNRAPAYTGATANGVMFDLEASSDLKLRTLQIELATGTYNVAVYFRRGTFVGSEGTAAAWQDIGGATGIVSAGNGALSTVPLDDEIMISAGERIGFYVDLGNVAGLRINSAGSAGATAAANADLAMLVGRRLTSSFGGGGGTAASVRAVLGYPVCE